MKPTLILSADRHYRDNKPRARTDDYWEAQCRKHLFIDNLQKKYKIPCLDAGDFFNTWKSSPFLEGWLIRNINNSIITVPGNHEIPDHNTDKLDRSSLSVLEAAESITLLKDGYKNPVPIPSTSKRYNYHLVFGFHYGSVFNKKATLEIPEKYKDCNGLKIAVAHMYVYTKYSEWMSKDAVKINAVRRLAPQFDLIVTGHNHLSFNFVNKNSLVVNPGSMMRSRITQIDYKPAVFLWYDENNSIEPIYLPIEENTIEKEIIKINSFSEELKTEEDIISEDIELLFKKNLQFYYNRNNTREEIIDFIDKGFCNEKKS